MPTMLEGNADREVIVGDIVAYLALMAKHKR